MNKKLYFGLGVCLLFGENCAMHGTRLPLKKSPSRILLDTREEKRNVPQIDKIALSREMPEAVKERIDKQKTEVGKYQFDRLGSAMKVFSKIEPNINENDWLRLAESFGIRKFHGYDVVDISWRSFVDYAQRRGQGEYIQQIQGYDVSDFKSFLFSEGIIVIESSAEHPTFVNDINTKLDDLIKNATGRHLFEKFLILKKLEEIKDSLIVRPFKTIKIQWGARSIAICEEYKVEINTAEESNDQVLLGNEGKRNNIKWDDDLLHELAHQFHYCIGADIELKYSGFLYAMLSNPYIAERFNPFLNAQFFSEFAERLNQETTIAPEFVKYLERIISENKKDYSASIQLLKNIGYGVVDVFDESKSIGERIATIYSVIFCYCWNNSEEAITISGAAPCYSSARELILITDDQNESIYQTRGYDLRRMLHYTNFFTNPRILEIIEELMRRHGLVWTPHNTDMARVSGNETEDVMVPELLDPNSPKDLIILFSWPRFLNRLEPTSENFVPVLSTLISIIQRKGIDNSLDDRVSNNLSEFMKRAAEKNLIITDECITGFLNLENEYPHNSFASSIWRYFGGLKNQINLTNWLKTAINDKNNLKFIAQLLDNKVVIIDDLSGWISDFYKQFPENFVDIDYVRKIKASLLDRYFAQRNPITEALLRKAVLLTNRDTQNLTHKAFILYFKQNNPITKNILQMVQYQNPDIIRAACQKYCEQKNPITETVLQEAMEAKDIEVIIACVAKYFLEQLSTHQEDNNDALLSDLRKMQEDPSIEKLIESLNRLKEAQSYIELEIKFFKFVGKNNLLDNADLMMQVAFNILKQCSDKDVYEIYKNVGLKKWQSLTQELKNNKLIIIGSQKEFENILNYSMMSRKINEIWYYLKKCEICASIERKNTSSKVMYIINCLKKIAVSQRPIEANIISGLRKIRHRNDIRNSINEILENLKSASEKYGDLEKLFLSAIVKYELFKPENLDLILEVAFKMLRQESGEGLIYKDIEDIIRKVIAKKWKELEKMYPTNKNLATCNTDLNMISEEAIQEKNYDKLVDRLKVCREKLSSLSDSSDDDCSGKVIKITLSDFGDE